MLTDLVADATCGFGSGLGHVFVHELHRHRAFADCRGHWFDRAVTNVACGEDPRPGALEHQGQAVEGPSDGGTARMEEVAPGRST